MGARRLRARVALVAAVALITGCGGSSSGGGTTGPSATSQTPGVSSGTATTPTKHKSTKTSTSTSPSSAAAVVSTPTTSTPTTPAPTPPPVSALTLCRRQIAAKTGLTETQRKLLDKLCVQIRGPKQTTKP